MAKNNYLFKQKIAMQVYTDVGLQLGRQQILDMMTLVLRDPRIMGKDTFGKKRLIKIVNGINEYIEQYQKAWEKHDEADYYQSKMDEALAKAYGEELCDSFFKRYEFLKKFDYKEGKWK